MSVSICTPTQQGCKYEPRKKVSACRDEMLQLDGVSGERQRLPMNYTCPWQLLGHGSVHAGLCVCCKYSLREQTVRMSLASTKWAVKLQVKRMSQRIWCEEDLSFPRAKQRISEGGKVRSPRAGEGLHVLCWKFMFTCSWGGPSFAEYTHHRMHGGKRKKNNVGDRKGRKVGSVCIRIRVQSPRFSHTLKRTGSNTQSHDPNLQQNILHKYSIIYMWPHCTVKWSVR